jgi:hypothetical protein
MCHPHCGTESKYLTLVLYYKLQELSVATPAAQWSVSYPQNTYRGVAIYSLSLLSQLPCMCQAKIKHTSSKLHRCSTQHFEDRENCNKDADQLSMLCLQRNIGRIRLLTQGISASMSNTTGSILLRRRKLMCLNASIPARTLKVISQSNSNINVCFC